jgi:hypothetical protein
MRVFVYQAYIPAGGTYMAYHVGRVLDQHFGLDVLVVGAGPGSGMFSYPVRYPVIDEDRFLREVNADDLFICNPSFSSQLFGLRLPCRKLTFVQNIRTYAVLDVFFDHYVCVSDWVRRFLTGYYGIEANVIPAFINTDIFHFKDNWEDRRPVFLVMERKHESLVFQRLLQVFTEHYPGVQLPYEIVPMLPQRELAERFRESRYFLSLDTMEGFGLPMLEAMACGCSVAGWDAGGCNEYALHGKNALLARYGDLKGLASHMHFLLTHPVEARELGISGGLTGPKFSLGQFDQAWIRELTEFLRMPAGIPP